MFNGKPLGFLESPAKGKKRVMFKFSDSSNKHVFPGIYYINNTFWEKFKRKKKLGEGTSAIVRQCVRRKDRKKFAVKIVRTRDEEITEQVPSCSPRS